jgi:predicted RNA-binding protein YlxR (DUF448 family)
MSEAARQSRERQRRCAVSGETVDEARLVRFVAGPGGEVTPDVARKLPGRGVWVEANRKAVDEAVRRNAFARSAKARLTAPVDLADRVESLLRTRILAALGLARRSGDLILGFDKVGDSVRSGRAAWLIEASDGSSDGRDKLLALARRQTPQTRPFGVFSGEELSLALGAENVIHAAFLAGRGADSWTVDVERLSGFRPLLPESWREEP